MFQLSIEDFCIQHAGPCVESEPASSVTKMYYTGPYSNYYRDFFLREFRA